MTAIQDYNTYTTRMQKSAYDKMFFVDKIFDDKIDTLIDFGCADGMLIRQLHAFMPNIRFIGYDIDETFLAQARIYAPFAEFHSCWDDIRVDPKTTIVNLSSVLHEIYSYSSSDEIELFWRRICKQDFAYITIRDMFFSCDTYAADDMWRRAIQTTHHDMLRQYEQHWGRCRTDKDYIHFLLKYRYTENWDREMRENYFSVSASTVREKLTDYREIYRHYTTLPYIVHQVQQDFGLDISDINTHMHWIFKHK